MGKFNTTKRPTELKETTFADQDVSCVTIGWVLGGLDATACDEAAGVETTGRVAGFDATGVVAAGVLAAVMPPPDGPGTEEKSVSVDAHPVSNNPDNNIKGTKAFMPIS